MKIGVKLWMDGSPELGRELTYLELRDIALQIEMLGFDSIWFMDHLVFRDEKTTHGVWEAWTLLSALAEATSRIELGSLVLCSQFRNPAVLAKMAVTLDAVSNGRFILGLGAGWNKPEFEAFGLPFDHRVSRFEEAIKIIRPLLKDGHVDFTGKYYQAHDCQILPRGPRPEGPPILIGGTGPRMLRLAAQYADMWNITGRQQPESLKEPLNNLKVACDEAGRDMKTLAITAQIQVAYPEFGSLPGWMTTFLSGSDREIADELKRFADIGVTHLMTHCGPYNLKTLTQLAEAIKLFRKK